MTAREHNRLVGIFLFAHGTFQALVMALVCAFYAILGSAILATGRRGEEQMVGAIFIGVIAIIAIVSAVLVLPQIIGGYKLWRERPNARIWGIAGSILSCLSFPFGTAAGVYGMWFLFGDQGKYFHLDRYAEPMMFQHPPQPPPPNSWQ